MSRYADIGNLPRALFVGANSTIGPLRFSCGTISAYSTSLLKYLSSKTYPCCSRKSHILPIGGRIALSTRCTIVYFPSTDGRVILAWLAAHTYEVANRINYCQILARQAEIPQKRSKNIVFSWSRVTRFRYADTQKLNCRCQELDLIFLLSDLCPTGGILPHLVSFYPIWRILPPILKMSETL